MTHSYSISVIIPVYNGAEFLARAINSVLDQTVQVSEIIVVDDGSKNRIKDIVNQFGQNVIYHYQENAGPASARNKGIGLANGSYISFIDADDLWVKEKLKWHLRQFQNIPELEISLGLTKRFLSTGVEAPLNFNRKDEEKSQLVLHVGAGLYKKSVFDEVGLFDESMLFSEDIDWFLRAIEISTRIAVLEKTVQLYRIHDNNLTHDLKKNQHYLLRAFKLSLDRRRENDPEKPVVLPDIRNPERLRNYFMNNI